MGRAGLPTERRSARWPPLRHLERSRLRCVVGSVPLLGATVEVNEASFHLIPY